MNVAELRREMTRELRKLGHRVLVLEELRAPRGRPGTQTEKCIKIFDKILPCKREKVFKACLKKGVHIATVHRARVTAGVVSENGMWSFPKGRNRSKSQ